MSISSKAFNMMKKMLKLTRFMKKLIQKWMKDEKNIEKPKNRKCFKNIVTNDQKFKNSSQI